MNTNKRAWATIFGIGVFLALTTAIMSLTLGIQYDYTLLVVASGGAILGMLSGVIGSFAVLRQQSLMGDALSHAALPGVAIAFLVAGKLPLALFIGAGIAGLIGIFLINSIVQTTRIKQDSAMGMILTSFFALGVALLSYIQSRGDGRQAGLDHFIFGQAAALRRDEVLVIAIISVIIFLVIGLFWKEFKLITFNREFALANGYPVSRLDALLSLLIVANIVIGLQLAGVILMVGLLIAPGVAARQWTYRLSQMVVLAALFGMFSGATGAIISGIDAGLPTGPLIIVVASIIVAISMSLAPERGVVWTWLAQQNDKKRFASSNILRDIYSHARQHDNLKEPIAEKTLLKVRGAAGQVGIKTLAHSGLIVETSNGWALTDKGIQAALKDARNQELWQLYRSHHMALSLPHIPEDREQSIDELLPKDAVIRLEQVWKGLA